MHLIKKIAVASALATSMSGCVAVATPTLGLVYTNVRAPIMATENEISSKQGTSCATSLLGMFAFGDASIEKAKRSASITKVSSVSYDSFSLLGIYGRFCTLVSGA